MMTCNDCQYFRPIKKHKTAIGTISEPAKCCVHPTTVARNSWMPACMLFAWSSLAGAEAADLQEGASK